MKSLIFKFNNGVLCSSLKNHIHTPDCIDVDIFQTGGVNLVVFNSSTDVFTNNNIELFRNTSENAEIKKLVIFLLQMGIQPFQFLYDSNDYFINFCAGNKKLQLYYELPVDQELFWKSIFDTINETKIYKHSFN